MSEPSVPPVPTPPELTRGRRLSVTLLGWLDRWRYRRVPDDTHTHTTLRLAAEKDDGHAAVDQWAIVRSARLADRRAELGAPPNPDRPVAVLTDSGVLVGLSGRDRLVWAQDRRDEVAALHRHQAELDHTQQSAAERRRIEAELDVLPDLVLAAKARWSARYEELVARYARARQRGLTTTVASCSLPPASARPEQPTAEVPR